jgi:hypothetical protein
VSEAIELPYNWAPRPYQRRLFGYLEHGGKRAVAVWHRRAGKDEVALHWTCIAAHQRVATYWHLLPEASQARKAIWDAINPHTGKRRIDEAFPISLRETTREQEMMIKFKNGSTWQVVGSDNYNSLVGSPPAGVVLSEWALSNPLAWGYLRPILLENDGWALFIYTSRGQNHGADTYEGAKTNPDWFVERLTADQTDVFTPEQLKQELKEYIDLYGPEMGKSLFNQEYYSSFDAATLGAVYAGWLSQAEDDGRITDVPHDPLAPVNTAWDLGYGDATAIWFYQLVHDEIHIIDYYEDNGKDTEFYCKILASKGYRYDKHYVPADANYKLMAAKGRSIAEQAWEHGVKMIVLPETGHANGIAATRKILGNCWFDVNKCKYGLKVLRNYKYKYNMERRVLSDEPLHDWASHGSRAFEMIGRTNTDTVYGLNEVKPRFLHEITANEVFFSEKRGIGHKERI